VSLVKGFDLASEALVDRTGTDDPEIRARVEPPRHLRQERLEVLLAASVGGALPLFAMAHRGVVAKASGRVRTSRLPGEDALEGRPGGLVPGDGRLAAVDPDDDQLGRARFDCGGACPHHPGEPECTPELAARST